MRAVTQGTLKRLASREITMKSKLRRPIATLLMASVFALAQPLPAQGAIAGAASDAAVRERVELLLVAHGVEVSQAKARAAALSDEELARVAAEFDQLPAGGNPAIVAIVYAFAWVVAMGFLAVFKLVEAVVKEARK